MIDNYPELDGTMSLTAGIIHRRDNPTTLIKTDNYLILIDDKPIEVGDWFRTPDNVYHELIHPEEKVVEGSQRVIAHLPLKNSPILSGIDLLPPLEVGVNPNKIVDFKYDIGYKYDDDDTFTTHRLRVPNPQGQTVLLGEYIYNNYNE